jgi:hypothetical protein
MAHLLLIFLVMMRQHVDDKNLRTRTADARHFGQRAYRLRRVVKHQGQKRRIELTVLDWQRFELAAADVDVAQIDEPPTSSVEHLCRAVNGDHALHVWRDGFGELAGAASEVADGQRGGDETEDRP